jgi:PII-like signaling protein
MKIEGPGKLLRIFIGEADRWRGRSLAEAIVLMLREAGLAGATVIHGVEGFGANSRIHTAHILRLSEDLPVVIEVVDQEERIRSVLPKLDEMVQEGLVCLTDVDIVMYRHSESSSG